MTNPTSSSSQFDRYADSYNQVVRRSFGFLPVEVDYLTRVKAAYLVDLLRQHFGDIRNVELLDVGCGIGNLHPLILDRVGSVSGVDVSRDCVTRAAQRNPRVDYRHFDGARLPFDEARFDAVTAICVIHHVAADERPGLVTELRRVLKPGGLAVIFEHNPRNPLTRRIAANCEFDRDAVLLPITDALRLLRGAGFTDLRARSILSVPSFGALTRGVDLALGRLSLGAQYYVRAVA